HLAFVQQRAVGAPCERSAQGKEDPTHTSPSLWMTVCERGGLCRCHSGRIREVLDVITGSFRRVQGFPPSGSTSSFSLPVVSSAGTPACHGGIGALPGGYSDSIGP